MNRKSLTPLELYRVLPKTNCGLCLLPTCLAFSAAVVAGRKQLTDCPSLVREERERLSAQLIQRSTLEPAQAELIDRLEQEVAALDFAEIAPKVGGVFRNGILTVQSLGKEFQLDREGRLTSDCHVIPWVQAPLLSYIANEKHKNPTGNWISFRELPGGMDWQGLFSTRCEKVLKKLADEHSDLLTDIIDLFAGIRSDDFEADIGLILHPLPHIPILICYQAPDEDLASVLSIFFDECCGTNLPVRSIFTLCTGLVQMFDKIAGKHI